MESSKNKKSEYYRPRITDPQEKEKLRKIRKLIPPSMKLYLGIMIYYDCPLFNFEDRDMPFDEADLEELIGWGKTHNFSNREIKLLPSIIEILNEKLKDQMKCKTYLFLDDIRNPIDALTFINGRDINPAIYKLEWIIVRDYVQFVVWIIKNGLPELISFDHDLGEADERTGMDCAKWLVNYCLDNNLSLPKWAVHSANPAGYDNIKGLLLSFERNVKHG